MPWAPPNCAVSSVSLACSLIVEIRDTSSVVLDLHHDYSQEN